MKIENAQLKDKIELLEKFIREEGDRSRTNIDSLNLQIKEKESQLKLLANDLKDTKIELDYIQRGWNQDRN